jgi:hypothetical protein
MVVRNRTNWTFQNSKSQYTKSFCNDSVNWGRILAPPSGKEGGEILFARVQKHILHRVETFHLLCFIGYDFIYLI